MSSPNEPSNLAVRHLVGRIFEWLCFGAALSGVFVLALLLGVTCWRGLGVINWDFLSSFPSRFPDQAGILPALAGSAWLMVLTAVISVPIGIASAVFLEEYAGREWWVQLIRTNIANLAGVPSIVYAILGLAVFVKTFLGIPHWGLGPSLMAGALTLSLVILPVIIIASQEALRAVPPSLRHASYALGATRWQTVWHQVLPSAMPGIMTGVILALSRAIGEAAPLVTVGAVGFIYFTPQGVTDEFTALPLQIFQWSGDPDKRFHDLAAGGIIVLMTLLLAMNGVAIFIRYTFTTIRN